jgi:hypothetical protein
MNPCIQLHLSVERSGILKDLVGCDPRVSSAGFLYNRHERRLNLSIPSSVTLTAPAFLTKRLAGIPKGSSSCYKITTIIEMRDTCERTFTAVHTIPGPPVDILSIRSSYITEAEAAQIPVLIEEVETI